MLEIDHVEIKSTKIFYGVVRSLRGNLLQQRIHINKEISVGKCA